MRLVVSSISFEIRSFSSSEVSGSSSLAFSSTMSASSRAMKSAICFFSASLRARSSSFERASIEGYTALIFSR